MMTELIQLAARKRAEARKRAADALPIARAQVNEMRAWHCEQHATDISNEVTKLEHEASIAFDKKDFFADLRVTQCASMIEPRVREAVARQRAKMVAIGLDLVNAAEAARNVREARSAMWAAEAYKTATAALAKAKSSRRGTGASYADLAAFIGAAHDAQNGFAHASEVAERRIEEQYHAKLANASAAGTAVGVVVGIFQGLGAAFALIIAAYIVTCGAINHIGAALTLFIFGIGAIAGARFGANRYRKSFCAAVKRPE
jgi:hypothetical protein